MSMLRNLLFSTVVLTCAGVAQDPAPSTEARTAPAGVEALIKQLGDESFRDRLEAENKLRELGAKARKALEAAAGNGDDREVQWRARRLLRQLDKAEQQGADEAPGAGGLVERARGDGRDPKVDAGGGAPDRQARADAMRDQFNRLFRRFERDFGVDIPRHRFFDDTFFHDLQSQLKAGASGAGMSVQIGPDGVVVKVQETGEDGKAETKTYEAPDLETFRKNYPGVLQQNGLGLGLDPFDGKNLRGMLSPVERGFDWQLLKPQRVAIEPMAPLAGVAPVPPAAGRRLGVLVKPLPDAVRDYLELDADTGLMVQEVQDDTLAAAAKLQANDIVTAIGGSRIGSAADVASALGKIGKGSKVTIEFVRKGRAQTVEVEKRFDAAPTRAELPKKAGKQRAEIR